MFAKLISVTIFLIVASGSAHAQKISFSAYSEMKSSAEKVGKFIGVLDACQNNEQLIENLNSPMMKQMIGGMGWNPEEDPSSDEVYKLVIDNMEATDLDFSMLSDLDDVMRNARNEFSNRASAMGFEQAVSVCTSVMPQASVFQKEEVLPDDPVERMYTYAKISPLQ